MSSFWKRVLATTLLCLLWGGVTSIPVTYAQDDEAGVTDASVPPEGGVGPVDASVDGPDVAGPAVNQTGTCSFSCTPQIAISCTQNSDCLQACVDRCPALVDHGVCLRTTARCADVGGGRKSCAFDCGPQIEAGCRTGDAGTASCGSSCNARCVQPPGPPTGIIVRCSQTAPTCNALGETPTTPTINPDAPPRTGSMNLSNPIPGGGSIPALAGKIIKGVLGIVGALALLMFVYGGVLWILSAGDPKAVSKAKDVLKNATIGLFLIFFSYGLSGLVIKTVLEVGSSSSTSAPSAAQADQSLSTCVQAAVRARTITLNDARDRTNATWSCRESTTAERASTSRTCVRSGCAGQPASVACCAPAAP